MVAVINDPYLQEQIIADRRARGIDHYDEVWEGVYMMAPIAGDEHQDFVGSLTTVFEIVIGWTGMGKVRPGVNVSDRRDDWTQNYRVPDVAVFLNDTQAELCGAFWYGGPDFAVEITSPGDRTREKFDFYAKVNTRELMIVERDPWTLELYRLKAGALQPAGKSTLDEPAVLSSNILPLSFQLLAGERRPQIAVTHADGQQRWTV